MLKVRQFLSSKTRQHSCASDARAAIVSPIGSVSAVSVELTKLVLLCAGVFVAAAAAAAASAVCLWGLLMANNHMGQLSI